MHIFLITYHISSLTGYTHVVDTACFSDLCKFPSVFHVLFASVFYISHSIPRGPALSLSLSLPRSLPCSLALSRSPSLSLVFFLFVFVLIIMYCYLIVGLSLLFFWLGSASLSSDVPVLMPGPGLCRLCPLPGWVV